MNRGQLFKELSRVNGRISELEKENERIRSDKIELQNELYKSLCDLLNYEGE